MRRQVPPARRPRGIQFADLEAFRTEPNVFDGIAGYAVSARYLAGPTVLRSE